MVNNIERGWELPGGWVEEGELPEEAALRELFEEVGFLGVATHIEKNFFEGGDLVKIEVNESPEPIGWESQDEKIMEVGWCLEIPEMKKWDIAEIEKVRSHDWSDSESLRFNS
tara:strand:+ start:5059 stop:5397 length:339 start_codon:yes stop_codon:yes gene_type:complete